MALCPGSSPVDLEVKCVRALWATFFPVTLTLVFLLSIVLRNLPYTTPIVKLFKTLASPFSEFISLEEAEALLATDESQDGNGTREPVVKATHKPPFAKNASLSIVSWLQAVYWASLGIIAVSDHRTGDRRVEPEDIATVLVVVPWLYSALRPIIWPFATVPYDVFYLLLVHVFSAMLRYGGAWYDHAAYGIAYPPREITAGWAFNVASILFALGVVLSLPLNIPGDGIDKEKIGKEISPEDYTVLWKWITFEWVWPLLRKGTNTTLKDEDVWKLSATQQTRVIFHQYQTITRSSLLRKLLAANSLDFFLDFTLTLGKVTLNYTSPIFLRLILETITASQQGGANRRDLALGFAYAIAMFICDVIKGQLEVHHLWFGRRIATRLRGELSAALYEKALKRKDFSGVANKEQEKEQEKDKGKDKGKTKDKDKDKDKGAKGTGKDGEEDPNSHKKGGADVGKIVQLMAGDVNRIAMIMSGIYFLYGAPFEILFAMILLYRILGVSAFAGVLVFFITGPLNNYLMRRAVNIQKGVLVAKDKRMGVLNEIITSVKFIKFFAWEEKWIDRAHGVRKNELAWLVKARMNSIMLNTVWIGVPIFVSVFSFLTFILLGNELTVATAFTSIALFGMLRLPLNVIPSWAVMLLQAKVSVDRLETFFNEEEVDEQFSSLKKNTTSHASVEETTVSPLGIKSASFRWNAVQKKDEEKEKAAKPSFLRRIIPFMGKKKKDDAPAQDVAVPEGEEVRFELTDIDVVFPEGKLSLVTGPTASGKTALLMAMLGEMTMIEGSNGSVLLDKDEKKLSPYGYGHYVSYAAQSPWLQHSSIQDNILFGQPMDPKRYDDVLEACALKPDLAILEDGDKTEIGARGVNLSGGQKARVALARAAYARSQYVLLDDPLSAVDSHTARILYDQLLRGPLLANRTVVLVTHHVELVLQGAHYIVRMLDGRIDEQGLVEDLKESGKLEYIAHEAELQTNVEIAVEELQEPTADKLAEEVVKDPESAAGPKRKPRKLIEDEHREEGAVKWSVYHSYVKASSYWIWSILLSLILLREVMSVGEKLWIKVWGDAYNDHASILSMITPFFDPWFGESGFGGGSQISHVTIPYSFGPQENISKMEPLLVQSITLPQLPSVHKHPLFYVGVYTAIGLGSLCLSVASMAATLTGALRASRVLFKKLLDSVMYATIRFHDTTPAGRLLNRFSKDIETIDSSLAQSLQSLNSTLTSFIVAIITVTVISPGFFAAAIVIGYVYYILGVAYLNTGRDLRRMESNNRSPVISGFSELLDGIVTVRAFSAERRFLGSVFGKIDSMVVMWYSFWMTNRWLLLHYDLLSAFALLLTVGLSLAGGIDAGLAGVAITSAMNFTNLIYWTCRNWTSLELDLNSVERVVEYLELPKQPPSIIENSRPPAYWPSSTTTNDMIVVKDLVVQYAPDLPNVLHGVSFNLRGRERVGLLGRTGSGKSTLAMSMLRFVDPVEGSISIDGIDITKIGLYDLRSRLTFIPQDATLFSGTIRDNLDPFGEYSDEECQDVLGRVHLVGGSAQVSRRTSRAPSIHEAPTPPAEGASPEDSPRSSTLIGETDASSAVAEIEKGSITLETKVSAGGSNFSQGQRQLIALARALLRQSSIIIMDEATSSIDFKTDAKIQETIRQEFKNSLLLTVAHRLRTVIDYDRLVVLDQGRLAEFDTPWNLIRKEGGVFREMCLKSGTFKELEAAARMKAELQGELLVSDVPSV